jgi:hypothetical protein
MSEGDNSNSSTVREDALKREPLLPIVCLPFWKKKRGLGGRGRELDVIHGLLFQFLMPARQTSTFLSLSLSLLLPHIAYCLRTNGKHYAKTDQVLDLLKFITREV